MAFFTDSFYSSQVFLVIDLSDQSLLLDHVPALFETNGTVRALPALSLIVSSRFFPALRPSAHFVARCRGKPRTRPLLEAGLRIGPPVFVAALSFFSTAVSHLFFGRQPKFVFRFSQMHTARPISPLDGRLGARPRPSGDYVVMDLGMLSSILDSADKNNKSKKKYPAVSFMCK